MFVSEMDTKGKGPSYSTLATLLRVMLMNVEYLSIMRSTGKLKIQGRSMSEKNKNQWWKGDEV